MATLTQGYDVASVQNANGIIALVKLRFTFWREHNLGAVILEQLIFLPCFVPKTRTRRVSGARKSGSFAVLRFRLFVFTQNALCTNCQEKKTVRGPLAPRPHRTVPPLGNQNDLSKYFVRRYNAKMNGHTDYFAKRGWRFLPICLTIRKIGKFGSDLWCTLPIS